MIIACYYTFSFILKGLFFLVLNFKHYNCKKYVHNSRKQEEASRVARAAAELNSVPNPASMVTNPALPMVPNPTLPMVSIPTGVLAQVTDPDNDDGLKHEPMSDDSFDEDEDLKEDDSDDEEGVDPLENSMKPIVKPVVRKRAPVFPFEVRSSCSLSLL